MKSEIVGRKEEIKILEKAIHSNEAELVAVTGRRRIGKTFLVQSVYQNHIIFEMIGTQNASLEIQLANFTDQLNFYAKSEYPIKKPENWTEAFRLLRIYLQNTLRDDKKVIFFDELPWLAGSKSGFLSAFGYFWNSWASKQNLVVVICGSAASWMIQKVVNDKGGLHNRITKHIHLEAFTLGETKEFLEKRGVFYNNHQIVELFMALGGIPHYLKEIDPTKSVVQNIDSLCFSKTGLLFDEFNRVYHSLFANAEKHLAIIRALFQRKQGLTRNQIAELSKVQNGGGLTKILEELTISGFVSEIFPFGKQKKDKLFRITDEYSLFYLQFIENNQKQGKNTWQYLSQLPAYWTWAGYAFEGICLKHIDQIRKALQIFGIYSSVSSFYHKGNEHQNGVQIDMVLDRNDKTIDLFELKFYNQPFILSKEYADKLRKKLWDFKTITKTNKQLNWVLISNFGLQKNQHSIGLINKVLTIDDLFE